MRQKVRVKRQQLGDFSLSCHLLDGVIFSS